MEKRDFAGLENLCQLRFMEAGECFHVCSRENHPVLFHNSEEFRQAMNIVAFVAFLFKDVRILTFEIMDNHFHFTLAGRKPRIELFISALEEKLQCRDLDFKIYTIEDLENLRNVICYDNRNGAVVNPNENVFSYEWGANRFFFNREAKLRYAADGRKATCREIRDLFHSDKLLKEKGIYFLDDYISPMCYCHISEAESFFRNSRHYFFNVARNVEAAKDIAKSIGERVFYTDEDLLIYVRNYCKKKHGGCPTATLPAEAKIELSKELHFDFNASNKQICRLLKLDIKVLNSLFPDLY